MLKPNRLAALGLVLTGVLWGMYPMAVALTFVAVPAYAGWRTWATVKAGAVTTIRSPFVFAFLFASGGLAVLIGYVIGLAVHAAM